ncbi:hypothetical protein ATK36_1636 [Amycolatopsis sulphurea]|uniref:PE family protein n=1 Tax=Amycolatopsis sulphurea TaxID=76022 RepID=A0A2A9F751_9PSEU|nr:hypothetical protein [Amycolatopsis sulphurea]PFG46646.1 hypothetical protein ATK36_1636 [Amycolatopsis sulphurea]
MTGEQPQPEQPKAALPPVPPIQVDGYGPGGGYVFNAEEAGGVIKQWEDLLVGLRDDLGQARAVANVTAPADEVASHVFINNGAEPSGQSLLAEHQAMVDYSMKFITALKAAKNKITVAEQEAADSVKEKGEY